MLLVPYLLSSLPDPESIQMFGGHMLQGNTGPSLVPEDESWFLSASFSLSFPTERCSSDQWGLRGVCWGILGILPSFSNTRRRSFLAGMRVWAWGAWGLTDDTKGQYEGKSLSLRIREGYKAFRSLRMMLNPWCIHPCDSPISEIEVIHFLYWLNHHCYLQLKSSYIQKIKANTVKHLFLRPTPWHITFL